MLKLRGHHLICLHFFSGEGYDSVFTENLTDVLRRAVGEDIKVCGDADDVCEKCPYRNGFKCKYAEDSDEDIRKMDDMALSLLGMEKGSIIRWEKTKEKLPEIFHKWHKHQCRECEWHKVCEKSEKWMITPEVIK